MDKLFVPLARDQFDRLRKLARAERRRPQEQAAYMLEQALDQRAGPQPPAPDHKVES
jgi:hypothetical protein